jgi:hypothetical protein
MPNLREMIDNRTICAGAPKVSKPSPVAQHVASHVQDPVGATKDTFSKLTQKKMEYDMAREEAQRNLAPVQSTLTHISQMHGIQPGMGTPGMMPAQQPVNPDDPEQYDENGNPINMQQTTGQMNMNRPSQVGSQPGVAPGPAQSVVPPKMGMPKPGQPGMQNPMAKKPAGNKSLPGAKGPGDPKVANKTKKAQNSSPGKEVELHIKGSGDTGSRILAGASNRLETQLGLGMLKFGGVKSSANSIIPKGGDLDLTGKTVRALASNLGNKATDMGESSEVAYNPKFAATSRKKRKSAKKAWKARGKGHLSAKEKKALYESMSGGGPGSGRKPGTSTKYNQWQKRTSARNKNTKLNTFNPADRGGSFPYKGVISTPRFEIDYPRKKSR